MLESPDGVEVFVLFGPQDATILLGEASLSDTDKYLTITPELAARMLARLAMANHNLHCVLVAFEAKDYSLAHALTVSEKATMFEFLDPLV